MTELLGNLSRLRILSQVRFKSQSEQGQDNHQVNFNLPIWEGSIACANFEQFPICGRSRSLGAKQVSGSPQIVPQTCFNLGRVKRSALERLVKKSWYRQELNPGCSSVWRFQNPNPGPRGGGYCLKPRVAKKCGAKPRRLCTPQGVAPKGASPSPEGRGLSASRRTRHYFRGGCTRL